MNAAEGVLACGALLHSSHLEHIGRHRCLGQAQVQTGVNRNSIKLLTSKFLAAVQLAQKGIGRFEKGDKPNRPPPEYFCNNAS